MATDKGKLVALLTEFGVPMEHEIHRPGTFAGTQEYAILNETRSTVQLNTATKEGSKVVGYSNFLTNFYFDKDDNFLAIGIWE